jgi:glyoxylase-like metal-dependent hydrolase (beta-lactamase superfamily II)
MRFKTTKDFFNHTEYFDPNWMDTNDVFLKLPNHKEWDYQRNLKIEDIDLWEIIYEGHGGSGVYAAWAPYAEYYLLNYYTYKNEFKMEEFYGKNSQKKLKKRIYELGLNFILPDYKVWVEPENMWLYQ